MAKLPSLESFKWHHAEKGAIHGGQVRAAGDIEAPMIGSAVGVPTEIRIATDPYLEREIEKLKGFIESLKKVIKDLIPQARMMLEVMGGRNTKGKSATSLQSLSSVKW